MQGNQKAMRFTDAFRTFGKEQAGSGVFGVEAKIDGVNQLMDIARNERGLEEVFRAGFQCSAFGVGNPLDINNALKPPGEDFVFWFQNLFKHWRTFNYVSSCVKKSFCILTKY